MNPLVTVVIPCYNYGAFIEETVNSVLHSTYQNIEIIIVDDGSTDPDTHKVLTHLGENVRVRIISRENGGLSAARNTGIKAAHSPYILLLDADDLIEPTFIEKGIWILENEPSISYVYSLVQLFGERNSIWYTRPFNFRYLQFRNVIPACILIRYEAWKTAGAYDESMRKGYEDWEFILRMGKKGLYGPLPIGDHPLQL